MKNDRLLNEWLEIAADDLAVAKEIMRGRRKSIRATVSMHNKPQKNT